MALNNRIGRNWLARVFLVGMLVATRQTQADSVTASQPALANFSFLDVHGKRHESTEFREYRHLVVIFVGTECPLVQLYLPRLVKISEELATEGVGFIAMNANDQDSLSEVAAWARQHSIPFPVYKDVDQSVTDLFAATRTPEVFLLDESRRIRYRGRIDDQLEVGLSRPTAQHEYLRDAIEKLQSGQPVSVERTEPVGCLIGRKREARESSELTFAEDILPIIARRCSGCHQPREIGPFALLSYQDVADWSAMIRETVEQGRMPPWPAAEPHGVFANDTRLMPEEKALLFRWIDDGCPEGPMSVPITPVSRPNAEGWHIGSPDVVYTIGDKPFDLPATGDIDYQFYTVDPKLTTDRWIAAVEFLPGNRSVVHHAAVSIEYPAAMNRPEFGFFGYAPGNGPLLLPEGRAIRVPAGSLLKFQIHYTTNGTATSDWSRIGLKFTEAMPTTREMIPYGAIADMSMVIPPNAANYEIWAATSLDKDFELWSIFPHMHLRGKSAYIEAFLPDATVKRLLTIPRWDFNWQMTYELREPLILPKGTIIFMRATFDNSAENPANPDPSREVRWGRMTNDEMWVTMLNGFAVTPATPNEDTAVNSPPPRGE